MKDSKQKIREIIRNTIDEFAYEELAKMPEIIAQKQKKINMTKSQKSQQVHNDIFFGGEKKEYDTKFKIREGRQIKISSNELDDFQNDMANHLEGHTIDFIEQNVGGKKAIVNFPVLNGVPDAVVEAIIDRKLKIKMSLQNGLIFSINNLKITNENKELAPKLYNLYNTIFKKKFTDMLSSSEEPIEPTSSTDSLNSFPNEAPEGTADVPEAGVSSPPSQG